MYLLHLLPFLPLSLLLTLFSLLHMIKVNSFLILTFFICLPPKPHNVSPKGFGNCGQSIPLTFYWIAKQPKKTLSFKPTFHPADFVLYKRVRPGKLPHAICLSISLRQVLLFSFFLFFFQSLLIISVS